MPRNAIKGWPRLPGLATAAAALGLLVLASGMSRDVGAADGPQAWVRPWPQGARGAVSITFDDGYPSHLEVAAPLLEARGFGGTFFLTVDKLFRRGRFTWARAPTVAEWQAAALNHEIGSHTLSHVGLDTLDAGRVTEELGRSRAELQALFPQAPIASLAYPYARTSDTVVEIARRHYTTARLGNAPSGSPAHNDPSTADLLQLRSLFLCGGQRPQAWNAAVDSALTAGGWLVETLHPVNEEGFCSVRAGDFEEHLDHLSRLGDQVWVAPVGTVARRLLQWRRTDLRVVAASAKSVDVWLEGPAAGCDWRVVLRLDNPPEWRVVDREGRSLPVEVEEESLTFCWPADQLDVPLTLQRPGATAAATAGWGRVKEWVQRRLAP